MYVCLHSCMPACIHVFMHVCMYAFVYVCACVGKNCSHETRIHDIEQGAIGLTHVKLCTPRRFFKNVIGYGFVAKFLR